ncbi:MAG: hypothetical protein ABI679_05840 [Gemmatimonadota bacterium]
MKYLLVPTGVALILAVAGCGPRTTVSPASATGHEVLLGRFADDYGIAYLITDASWQLGSRDRYRIISWNDSARYLVAQNAESNVENPGKWTRIDWVYLKGMPPYEWAFCLSEYRASSRAEAEANHSADGMNPRKGCNGYPFSRMRRVPAESIAARPYQ